MGQLTSALKANKELRKQFKKQPAPKQKKLTKHHQEIKDAIYKSEPFGCNTKGVANLISKILKVDLRKEEENHKNKDLFNTVFGSALIYTKDGSGDFVIDTFNSDTIYWREPKTNDACSMKRFKVNWRPATDKEIREYFS